MELALSDQPPNRRFKLSQQIVRRDIWLGRMTNRQDDNGCIVADREHRPMRRMRTQPKVQLPQFIREMVVFTSKGTTMWIRI